jgi:GNAT superfamily N-acetyltransferase
MNKQEAAQLLSEASFKFAKTMPDMPHWYTLAVTWNERSVFEAVVQFIRDHGVAEKFKGRRYVYFYHKGYKYWTMGFPLPVTKLINRAEALTIEPIDIEDIAQFKEQAGKEGIKFCKDTALFGAYQSGQILGFSGLIYRKNKVIFKNNYVLPSHRRLGLFNSMLKFLLEKVKQEGFQVAEARCTDMSLGGYLKNGFKVVKRYKTGTLVRKDDLQDR